MNCVCIIKCHWFPDVSVTGLSMKSHKLSTWWRHFNYMNDQWRNMKTRKWCSQNCLQKKIMLCYHFYVAKVWLYVALLCMGLYVVLKKISFVGVHNVQQGLWYCEIYSALHILHYHIVWSVAFNTSNEID